MEILFADTYYDSEEWEEGKFAKEIVNNLRDFDSQVTAIDTDIGHGADLPGALVQIFNSIDISNVITIGGIGTHSCPK
jgi:hypothetical protein